ncbi:YkvA family protein [Pectinatus haikarae]|uniref:YkvA family protein n=1 Tax=Pectinatus haikarae TaxID=349096 RepID=UPI0018C7675E|nr:DUF1232 domain-containing protein [Pectinatus haikarae]
MRLSFVFKKCGYNLLVLLLAVLNKTTPKYQKGLIVFAVIYLFSPIDLIPDSVPIAGFFDDAVLGSAILTAVIKLLPENVKQICGCRANSIIKKAPIVLAVMAVISVIIFLLIAETVWKYFR